MIGQPNELIIANNGFLIFAPSGAFTLTETETETDKLQQTQWHWCISVQCEHLHIIPYHPFFIGLCISLGLC